MPIVHGGTLCLAIEPNEPPSRALQELIDTLQLEVSRNRWQPGLLAAVVSKSQHGGRWPVRSRPGRGFMPCVRDTGHREEALNRLRAPPSGSPPIVTIPVLRSYLQTGVWPNDMPIFIGVINLRDDDGRGKSNGGSASDGDDKAEGAPLCNLTLLAVAAEFTVAVGM